MRRTHVTIGRFRDWRRRTFPERQLFLRSEGRVRFVTITSAAQMVLAGIALALAVWGLVTSYVFLTRDEVLVARERALETLSADYDTLTRQYARLERDVEQRAIRLEERQQFMESLIRSAPRDPDTGVLRLGQSLEGEPLTLDGGLPQGGPTPEEAESLSSKPNGTATSGAGATTDAAARQPTGDDQPPSLATPRPTGEAAATNDAVGDQLTLLDRWFSSSDPEQRSTEPAQRRAAILAKLEATDRRQKDAAGDLMASLAKEVAEIDKAIQATKLSMDDLVAAWQGDVGGIGGPYIPDTGFPSVFADGDGGLFATLHENWLKLDVADDVLTSMPVGIPAEDYYISSRFGRRRDPMRRTWTNHPGLDMAGWPGTKIFSSAPGRVVRAGWSGPYGNMVEVDHDNGFKTRYGHLRRVRVKVGDVVEQGAHIGDMGKTGRTTGTHLHFEVWFGGSVRDPMPFLRAGDDVREIQRRYENPIS